MDNQHRQIKGYRELSQAEIDLMNEIKTKGAELQALCNKVDDHISGQYSAARGTTQLEGRGEPEEIYRLDASDAISWAHDAERQLQIGLMMLTRAVAQPTFF